MKLSRYESLAPFMTGNVKLLISDSERHADMLYVSGLFVPDPFVVIGLHGKWHGFFSPLEVDRAKKQSRLNHVHLDTQWHEKAVDQGWGAGLAGVAAAFLHEHRIRLIEVPADFPLSYAQQLSAWGFRVRPVEGTLFPERAVKTAREIKWLQQAEHVARSAMRVAERFLAACTVDNNGILLDPANEKKLKSRHLRAAIEAHIISRGAIPSHTIVACGREGADPHNIGSGYLRAGQPIIIDIFPRMQATGYWGDMTRTYVKGKAPDQVRRMYRAVREAQEIGLGMVKAGVNGADIHRAICSYFESAGFPNRIRRGRQCGFFHGTGHGVGLDIHESPRISQHGQILEEGNVVTIEPGLYYPGIGGVRLEDLVVVRRDGCDNLTRHPRRLAIP